MSNHATPATGGGELLRPFAIEGPHHATAVGIFRFSSAEPVCTEVLAGQTIADVVGPDAACQAFIDGYEVPIERWPETLIGAGQVVHYVGRLPGRGDAGKAVRLVAMAVLTYYTMGSGAASWGSTFTSQLVNTGIFIAGTLALNALIPPTSASDGAAADPYSQSNSLTGSSNQASPGGKVPCVLGQMKVFPPHAALPYTEQSGDDQFLRMLLDFGHGDLDVSDLKIGDTALTDYDGVDYEITKTPTLFTQDVYELQVGTVMNNTDDQDQRTSSDPVNELSVDLLFPVGLCGINAKNKAVSAWVYVDILFRQTGTSTWYGTQDSSPTLSSNAITPYDQSVYKVDSNTQSALRVGVRWKVPAVGQYDVMIVRKGAGYDSSVTQLNQMTWSVLRSITSQNPSTTGTLKLALRIKATDQLNGVVSTLSAIVAQKIPKYDKASGTWSANVATKNPAWIALWLLTQCPAVARRLSTDRVDLNVFADWAAECDAKGYSYCATLDSAQDLGSLYRAVLAAGRASFGTRNGKYAPVRDLAQTTPVQMFTPVNSWGFQFTRDFTSPPHALKVQFLNPEADYQEDERIVYWDGYNAGNATLFEALDLRMVDDPAAVWRLARYHLAVMWLRPNQYVFSADIESIVCERGDMVTHGHDLTGWGVAWGRIKAVSGNVVTLDAPVDLIPGQAYTLRVRRSSNTQVNGVIDQQGGGITWDSTTYTFDSTSWTFDEQGNRYLALHLTAELPGIAAGDLFDLGLVDKEVTKLIIRSIVPGDNLTAEITCVDAAPGVWTADSATPPAFTSQITGQPWCSPPAVPKLNIRIGTSTPNDSGLVRNEVGISADGGSGIYRMPIRAANGLTIQTQAR